ncbi:metallophosphoesterase [candidate division SR1 bacterium RAAC1_SR1_1]|nr:metallophosphoesterase [candidate division SR1 bacterium RAAC1_SR1_1]
MKKRYKTVILSDIHLGKPNNLSNKLLQFLENCTMERIIFNGDAIDFWQLNTFGARTEKETRFVNYIIKLIESGVHVTYIKGNHDGFMKHLHNVHVHNISIVKDLVYTTATNKKYYLCHGDKFDFVNDTVGRITNFFYSLLYLLEKRFNKDIAKEHYVPFSERSKMRFKRHFFPKKTLHRRAFALAKEKECDGIIIGHYHMPDHVKNHTMEYFNTGDWIASCTAVVENEKGELELIHYK